MKLFLIRILLRLLHIELTPVESKRIKMFLWSIHPQQGFQDYVKERDMTILQEMGNALSREDYLIKLGQRTEVGMWKNQSRIVFEKVNKDREAKTEALKMKAEKRLKEQQILEQQQKSGKNTENEAA